MRGPGADVTACAGGYLIGSVPVGLLIGRAVRGLDVREHGSGSIGTTNVLRLVGPTAAALTFGLDVGKGAVAVVAARRLGASRQAQAVAGFTCVVGHCWPLFAKFRGGKGVATSFGGVIAMSPEATFGAMAAGLPAVAATRIVSVGSLVAAAGAVAGAGVQLRRSGDVAGPAFVAAVAGLVVARHSANIGRLLRGAEPRVSLRRSS
ncbi:MAG TPA: glycerol-3-phosphate 1-O-acyltransferase PlsY [Dehalococcoidia bacterium]|nr:glycerol-3-phosphate 1-O-acyltransferase PlsY [Dehalococcoidia bacterium]